MRIFICDECGKEFPHPLDQEKYRDKHGDWHVFDLCAPCRKNMQEEVEDKPKEEHFKKLINKKVERRKQGQPVKNNKVNK